MSSIKSTKKALLEQLENNGWQIEVEDDYSNFKHFQAFKKEAPFKALKWLDLILISPVDGSSVEIRFLFYADPGVVGADKRQFGKKVRENNFEVLRVFCEDLLKKAGIDAREDGISISPRSRIKINFGDGNYLSAAYEVELVYSKC